MLNRSQTITNADPARAISAEMALLRKQGLQNFSLALSAQRCVINVISGVLHMALLALVSAAGSFPLAIGITTAAPQAQGSS